MINSKQIKCYNINKVKSNLEQVKNNLKLILQKLKIGINNLCNFKSYNKIKYKIIKINKLRNNQ